MKSTYCLAVWLRLCRLPRKKRSLWRVSWPAASISPSLLHTYNFTRLPTAAIKAWKVVSCFQLPLESHCPQVSRTTLCKRNVLAVRHRATYPLRMKKTPKMLTAIFQEGSTTLRAAKREGAYNRTLGSACLDCSEGKSRLSTTRKSTRRKIGTMTMSLLNHSSQSRPSHSLRLRLCAKWK